MRGVVHERYGPPSQVLEVVELEPPEPQDDEVLVRVHAASVNPVDWHGVTGRPMVGRLMGSGLRAPKERRVGSDFAGTVERVGKKLTGVAPGDEILGVATGALAELAAARRFTRKPHNVSLDKAASVPIAGVTALQGLRDKGALRPGQRVLINGASGGVGTFAIQIAKALGGEVTAVCSPQNVDIARSLGADRVIDYTREDFTRGDARYDLVLDIAGSRRWSEVGRVLAPDATHVVVGAPKGGRLLGPLSRIARLKLASLPSRQRAIFFIAKITIDDLHALSDLIETGAVTPVIDRIYALGDVGAAFDYLGQGHARGKIVVTI